VNRTEITRRALALPKKERLELARLLIESVPGQLPLAADSQRIQEIPSEETTQVSAEDESALEETEFLLRSPANARRLMDAINDLEQGKGIQVSLEDLEKE
jgi:antitoxin YefM